VSLKKDHTASNCTLLYSFPKSVYFVADRHAFSTGYLAPFFSNYSRTMVIQRAISSLDSFITSCALLMRSCLCIEKILKISSPLLHEVLVVQSNNIVLEGTRSSWKCYSDRYVDRTHIRLLLVQ